MSKIRDLKIVCKMGSGVSNKMGLEQERVGDMGVFWVLK